MAWVPQYSPSLLISEFQYLLLQSLGTISKMRSSLIITSLLLLPISAFALPVSSDAIERDYVLDGSLLSVKRSVWPKVGEGKALSEAAPPGPVLRPGFTTLPPSRWPDPGVRWLHILFPALI